MIAVGSGDLGGLNFRQTRQGLQVHPRPNRIKPSNNYSDPIKRSFAFLSNIWAKDVPETTRKRWSDFARTVTLRNRIGHEYNPTSTQLFLHYNLLDYAYFDHYSIDLPTHYTVPEAPKLGFSVVVLGADYVVWKIESTDPFYTESNIKIICSKTYNYTTQDLHRPRT